MLVHPRAAAPRLKPPSTPVQSSPVGSQLPPCHTRAIGMVCGLLHWASCCDLPSFCNAPIFPHLSIHLYNTVFSLHIILFDCHTGTLFLISNVYFQNLTSWCDLSSFMLLPFINLSIYLYICIESHTLFFLVMIPFSPVELSAYHNHYFSCSDLQELLMLEWFLIIIIIMHPINSFHSVFSFFFFPPSAHLLFHHFSSVVDCSVPVTGLHFDFPDIHSIILLLSIFPCFPFNEKCFCCFIPPALIVILNCLF